MHKISTKFIALERYDNIVFTLLQCFLLQIGKCLNHQRFHMIVIYRLFGHESKGYIHVLTVLFQTCFQTDTVFAVCFPHQTFHTVTPYGKFLIPLGADNYNRCFALPLHCYISYTQRPNKKTPAFREQIAYSFTGV